MVWFYTCYVFNIGLVMLYCDFFHEILQKMSDVYKEVPPWFWLLLFTGGGFVITALLTILVWFLKRFLEDNKESWKEIKNAVANLVQVTTKHEMKLFELDNDVKEVKADMRGLPYIKHR